jgi:O-antigen/teichoic acid export membrane protein
MKALVWQSTGQIGERVARLLTNIVLTRLLLPEDFGLAGVVTAALAAIDSTLFVASNQAILHSDRGRNREFLDTAFWMAAVRGVLIGLVLLAAAPFLAKFFNQPKTMAMFALLALQPVLSGLANPRSQILLKDLRFGIWSVYQVGCNVLGLLATILMALHLRSAWALVIGQVLTQFVVSAGSFVIAPFRPRWRFDWDSWRELRQFGLRASGTPLIIMLIMEAPAIILGRFLGMAVLGVFLLNHRLAHMPQNFFLRAISTVALPAYSSIKNNPVRLATLWLKALRTISLVMLPLGTALIWVDRALPQILYGSQFSAVKGLFSLLVVDGALISIGVVTSPLFWAVGLPSYDRNIQIVRLFILYGLTALLMSHYQIFGLAIGYAVSTILSQILVLVYARKVVAVTWRNIMNALAPGLTLAGLVLAMLMWLGGLFAFSALQTVIVGGVILVLALSAVMLHTWAIRNRKIRPAVIG